MITVTSIITVSCCKHISNNVLWYHVTLDIHKQDTVFFPCISFLYKNYSKCIQEYKEGYARSSTEFTFYLNYHFKGKIRIILKI